MEEPASRSNNQIGMSCEKPQFAYGVERHLCKTRWSSLHSIFNIQKISPGLRTADRKKTSSLTLRQLRDENAKLKGLVADLSLDRHILQEIVAKTVRPRARRELAEWAQAVHSLSQRRAARLIPTERIESF
jgi:putative transposase